MPGIFQVQSIETGLGFFQGNFHFAGLQHLVRMIRRKTKGHTTVYNIFSQSQSQVNRSFFCFFIPQRIIIQRTGHTRHRRIITIAILITNYLLQDNSHLFLIDYIRSGLHIRFTVAEINRSIHPFNSIRKHTQHFIPVIQIGNHICTINSGERLIMRVFQ